MTEAIPERVQFKKPNIRSESGEFSRVADEFGYDDFVLMYLAEQEGKTLNLNEEIWSRLENTDSYDIEEGDWQTVARHAGSVSRDYLDLKQKLSEGVELETPIVMKVGERLHLVSGNTRLMVARAFGLKPQVLIFEVEPHEV